MNQLPAGLMGEGIEVFRDDEGRVFAIQNGTKIPYLMLDTQHRELFQSAMIEDIAVINVLKKEFGLTAADDQEEMFVGCRFGNIDFRADLIDGKLMADAPRCQWLDTCKGFNIVCRIPKPLKGAFTRSEYRIIRLVVTGKQAKEIAAELNVSEATIRTHIQHIHAKLGVNNNVEVAAWAHEHRII